MNQLLSEGDVRFELDQYVVFGEGPPEFLLPLPAMYGLTTFLCLFFLSSLFGVVVFFPDFFPDWTKVQPGLFEGLKGCLDVPFLFHQP